MYSNVFNVGNVFNVFNVESVQCVQDADHKVQGSQCAVSVINWSEKRAVKRIGAVNSD